MRLVCCVVRKVAIRVGLNVKGDSQSSLGFWQPNFNVHLDPWTLLGTLPETPVRKIFWANIFILTFKGVSKGFLNSNHGGWGTVSVQLHAEGLQTFNCSEQQLQPISGRIVASRQRVLLVSPLGGRSKSHGLEECLSDAVDCLGAFMGGEEANRLTSLPECALLIRSCQRTCKIYVKHGKPHKLHIFCCPCAAKGTFQYLHLSFPSFNVRL